MINVEILGIARDAAFLWWMTGEKKYADLAASVFDTYMTGDLLPECSQGFESWTSADFGGYEQF